MLKISLDCWLLMWTVAPNPLYGPVNRNPSYRVTGEVTVLSIFTVNTPSLQLLSRLQFRNQPLSILVNVSTRPTPGAEVTTGSTGSGAAVVTGGTGATVVAGTCAMVVAGATGAAVVAGTEGAEVVTWFESHGKGGEFASTLIT